MLAKLYEFRWHVFSGGYHCEDFNTEDGKAIRLMEPNVLADDFGVEERYPLEEEPGLHRKFAALDLTEDAILSFVDEWGPLKSPHDFSDNGPDEGLVDFSWPREPTDLWFKQVKRMKALVGLWDVLKAGTERQLSEAIVLKESGDRNVWDVDIRFKDAPELTWGESFDERNWPGFYGLMGKGAERTVARMCLFDLVNESLWGSCSPGLKNSQKPEDLALWFCPHNLEAALWLLFVQEILGEKNLKQCVVCKNYFEVSKEEDYRRGRSDKKYCTPKCRAAAFRERRDNAAIESEKKQNGKETLADEKPKTKKAPTKTKRK